MNPAIARVFFGPEADTVAAAYATMGRQRAFAETLVGEIDRLAADRRAITQDDDTPPGAEAELDASESAHQELLHKRAKLSALCEAHAASIATFRRRMYLRITAPFRAGAMGVGRTRRKIARLQEEIHDVESAIHDAAEEVARRRRALRDAQAPLASLDYALNYLKNRRAEARADIARADAAVDAQIVGAARDTSLHTLRTKLHRLGDLGLSTYMNDDVLELKRLAGMAAALRAQHEPDVGSWGTLKEATRRVCEAVESGIERTRFAGQATIALHGSGTRHVRRTQWIGKHAHASWAVVGVAFNDTYHTQLAFEGNSWDAGAACKAVAAEAERAFRSGRQEALREVDQGLAQIQAEARGLVHRIRARLEEWEPERAAHAG